MSYARARMLKLGFEKVCDWQNTYTRYRLHRFETVMLQIQAVNQLGLVLYCTGPLRIKKTEELVIFHLSYFNVSSCKRSE